MKDAEIGLLDGLLTFWASFVLPRAETEPVFLSSLPVLAASFGAAIFYAVYFIYLFTDAAERKKQDANKSSNHWDDRRKSGVSFPTQ